MCVCYSIYRTCYEYVLTSCWSKVFVYVAILHYLCANLVLCILNLWEFFHLLQVGLGISDTYTEKDFTVCVCTWVGEKMENVRKRCDDSEKSNWDGIPYTVIGTYRCFGVDIATTWTRAELWLGGLEIEGVASAGNKQFDHVKSLSILKCMGKHCRRLWWGGCLKVQGEVGSFYVGVLF